MVQSWHNSDGLYIKYGPDKATAGKAGEYVMTGNTREVMVEISDMTTLGTSPAILSDTAIIPAGARIQRLKF